MMRTHVKFPSYDENCKTVSFLLGQSFTDHMQFKKALLKYAVQEKRDYIFVKNARYRVRVKCKDVHCNWAYFKTHSKCDSIDNNSTEAWNSVLIAARSKPIISMNEDLGEYLMERRIKRLNFARKWRLDYGPNIRDIVNENSTAGCKWKIKWNGDRGFNYPIEVVESEEFWPNSGHGDLLPPLPKAMPGRPRKARRKRKFEPKKSKTKLSRHGRDMHCGICKSSKHNKRTCSLKGDAPVAYLVFYLFCFLNLYLSYVQFYEEVLELL
ncbi:hypothetical protein CTI12_AA293930 [Artemisia annua]|uniref:Transposase MuDR plant domain-containing protein n=1 Tax=Artemisia annua TaxID=35608 RepID=A0A2U1MBP3_ARTAN|nr:hypothetical protein CTI12_AA293930 [Artemisia annua]